MLEAETACLVCSIDAEEWMFLCEKTSTEGEWGIWNMWSAIITTAQGRRSARMVLVPLSHLGLAWRGPAEPHVWRRAGDPQAAAPKALSRVCGPGDTAASKAVTLSDSFLPLVCSHRPLVTLSLLTLTLPSAPLSHAPCPWARGARGACWNEGEKSSQRQREFEACLIHLQHPVAENFNEIMQKKTDDGKIVQHSIRTVNRAGLYKWRQPEKPLYYIIISFPI